MQNIVPTQSEHIPTDASIETIVPSGIGRFTDSQITINGKGILTFGGDSQSKLALFIGAIQQKMKETGGTLVNLYVGPSEDKLSAVPFQIRLGLTMQQLLVSFNARSRFAQSIQN